MNVINERKYLYLISISLLIIIFSYFLIYITRNSVLFIFCFYISLVCINFLILFSFFLIGVKVSWKFIPLHIKKHYNETAAKFKKIIFFSILFFLFHTYAIHNWLLDRISLISFLTIIGVFILSIYLGWSLLAKRKISIALICFLSFIFIFSILLQNNLISKKPYTDYSSNPIKSIPYLKWVPAKKNELKSGVTKYKPDQSYKGLNLYNPQNLPKAFLMDMHGNNLHSWSSEGKINEPWHRVELYQNGNLLSIVKDKMLIKLDWHSDLIWKTKGRFHHDMAISEKKVIYVLSRKDKIGFKFGLPFPILNDYISIMNPNGKIKKEISLNKLIEKKISLNKIGDIYEWLLKIKTIRTLIYRIYHSSYLFHHDEIPDIYHTNTLEIIDKSISGFCKKGDLLICVRNLDLIGILDMKNKKFLWTGGNELLDKPHHPSLLKNGNILVFDNGYHRGFSRVLELDPLTEKIIWKYTSNPPQNFFSRIRGSSQRLPNGNTLITESDKGHAFELTKSGKIVWEFFTPQIKRETYKRAALYRLIRLVNIHKYQLINKIK